MLYIKYKTIVSLADLVDYDNFKLSTALFGPTSSSKLNIIANSLQNSHNYEVRTQELSIDQIYLTLKVPTQKKTNEGK